MATVVKAVCYTTRFGFAKCISTWGWTLLIVGGTSLTVYPAAGFLSYYRGNRLVLINRDPTPRDDMAQLIIRDPIGKVLAQMPDA